MTEPLRLSFDVDCPADHAFRVWTSSTAMWWPPDHTVSGAPESLTIEGRAGGRIVETTRDGLEHEWGRVIAWDPPEGLSFTWYLGRTPEQATEVEVRFVDADGRTTVEIEHRGWERLAADPSVRERTGGNWAVVVGCFASFV
jgi:uncharacterized protein YndB with AHSA1/START domain